MGGGALVGGWSAGGLDLVVPIAGTTYTDAVFDMDPVTVNMDDTLGSGTIRFYEDAGMTSLILQIDFDGGELHQPLGFGASFISANNVTFSGPVITTPLTDEQFSFSFANPTTTANGNSYTASFTSSAVPEPATLALVAVGALCCIRRRR